MSQNMSPFKLGPSPNKKEKGVKRKLMSTSPDWHALGDSQPQSTGPAYKFSQDQPTNWSPMVLKGMPGPLPAFPLLPAATGFQTPPAMGSPAKTDGTPKTKRSIYHVIAANDISMVVQPPIGFHNLHDYVGKLFVVEKQYETEKRICQKLVELDPQRKYLVYGEDTNIPVDVLSIQTLMSQHLDFKDAIEKETRRKRSNFKIHQMIMPYGGVSMKHITPLQPISFQQLIKYGMDVLNGVEILQRGQYVHQDIMLKNVLIDKGVARLADFGTVLSYSDVFTAKNDRLDDFSLAHPPEYFVKNFQTYYNNVAVDLDRKKFMKLHGYTNKPEFKDAFAEAMSNEKVYAYPGKIDVYSVGILMLQLLEKEDCVVIEAEDKIKNLKTVIKRMTCLSPVKRLSVHVARQQLEKLSKPTLGSPVMKSPMASPYKSVMTARTES
jgi:Protein tyrosine and serine/threonine kinase